MGICNFDSKKHKDNLESKKDEDNFSLTGIIEPVKINKPEEKIDPLEEKRNELNGKIESFQYNDIEKPFGFSTQIISEMYGNNKIVDEQNKGKDKQNINNESYNMADNQERNNSSLDKNSVNKINNSKNEPSINTPEENLNLPNTNLNDINNDNSNNNINNDDDNNISNDNKIKTSGNVSYNTPFDIPKRVESKNDDNSKMRDQSPLYDNNNQNIYYLQNSQIENNNPDNDNKIYINSKETPEHQNQSNTNNNEPNKNEDDQNYNLFSKNNSISNNINVQDQKKEIINSKNGEDMDQINNINSQNIENNNLAKNNYDSLDISKTYYMSCPYCKKYQPYIESIEYDTNVNDFLITYKCPCNSSDNNKKKAYFIEFLTEEEPENKCQKHSEKITFFCKTCQKHACFNCSINDHKDHPKDSFGKKYILSNDNRNYILNKIEENKEKFKGYDIISKLLNELGKGSVYLNNENNLLISKDITNSNNNIKISNFNQFNSINPDINNIMNENTMLNFNNAKNNNIKVSIGNNGMLDKNYKNDAILESSNYNIINNINNSINDNNKNQSNQYYLNSNLIQESGRNPTKILNPNSNNSNKANDSNGNILSKNKEIFYSKGYATQFNNSLNMNNNINNNNQIEETANLNQNNNNNKMNEINNNGDFKSQNLDLKYHEVKTLKGHSDKIVSLIELESGHIVTGSYDHTIRVWDLNKDICIMTKIESGYVFCLLEFEPNMILAGTSENNIDLWDISSQNNEIEFSFRKHILWVNCLVKCDDDHFASAGNDAIICIWDYKHRELKYHLEGHIDCILTLIKLKDGNLCSGSADFTIKIWDWKQKIVNLTIKTSHKKWVKCICQLNDGTLLSGSENICVWSKKYFSPIKNLTDHKHYIRSICQIDDNHFASGSFDKTIKIWDIRDFTVTQTIKAHDSNIICIIKLKDNKLVSCSNDKTIKIWERNF